jgi:DNA gyrase/topoisomerase IV subunit B
MENLRYNNIVIATDADVDGIRLLYFFSTVFPELIRRTFVYLQTPLLGFKIRKLFIAILRTRKSILKTETKTGNYPI